MTALPLLAAAAAAGAALLLLARPALPSGCKSSGGGGDSRRLGADPVLSGRESSGGGGGSRRLGRGWRRPWLLAGLAGAGVAVVLPGPVGWVGGLLLAAWVWRTAAGLGRADERRRAVEAADQVPVLVELVAGALRAGATVPHAVDAACGAWPGAAADRLELARSRLALGGDPVSVWDDVAADPALAPLGRAMARAASSGAPVADVVGRLADDLADRARGDAEDRARAVGVRAAVPLGLCLLPAFVVLGIVPLAAGLLSSLT